MKRTTVVIPRLEVTLGEKEKEYLLENWAWCEEDPIGSFDWDCMPSCRVARSLAKKGLLERQEAYREYSDDHHFEYRITVRGLSVVCRLVRLARMSEREQLAALEEERE